MRLLWIIACGVITVITGHMAIMLLALLACLDIKDPKENE